MTLLPLAYLPSIEQFAHLLRGGCIVDLGEHFIKRSERNRARILTTDSVMELTAPVCRANSPCQPMRDMRLDYSKRWQHQHWGALIASYKSSPYFDFYAEYLEPFYRRKEIFLVDQNLQLLETLCRLIQVPMPSLSESYITATGDDLDLRPKQSFYTPKSAILHPDTHSWQDTRQASNTIPSASAPGVAYPNSTPSTSAPGVAYPDTTPSASAPGVAYPNTTPSASASGVAHKKGPTFHAEPYVQVFSDRLPFEANLSLVDLLFAEGPASASVLRRCLHE